MPSIDERIVQMRFDNKQFEEGVATSMTTLDKLKQALAFEGSVSGIQKLGDAIGGLTLSPLQNGIDQVTQKFSLLGYMGLKVLTDIGNAAVSTGERLVKDLTLGQVTSGWDKYARKTEAVQTIISATGKSVEEVSEQLAKLNWFTDETSYNFVDMVNNIGKFTNNNIPLQQAVTAMEGISTWAASAGANVGEAGRAMYNLSQAVSVGSVKLMDWKSIENANMATTQFKQTAIDAAVALGKLEKTKEAGVFHVKGQKSDHTVSASNFNQNLSDNWFDKNVLMQALSQYGNFTNVLKEAMDKTGFDTTSDLLNKLKDYKEAIAKGEEYNFKELAKETGTKVKVLEDAFKELSIDVSFEDALNKALDLTKMKDHKEEFFGYLDEFNNGTKTIDEIVKDIESNSKLANVSAKDLEEAFYTMNHSGFAIGEKAFRMAQEAKTFGEAIDATRDAVSTAWMNFFEIIFGNYEEAKKLWTDLANEMWDVFAGPINDLNDIAKMWAQGIYDDEGEALVEAGRREKAIEAVYTSYGKLKDLLSGFTDSLFSGIFGDMESSDFAQFFIDLTDRFSEFANTVEANEVVVTNLQLAFEAAGRVIKLFSEILGGIAGFAIGLVSTFSPLIELASKWVGVISNVVIHISDLIEENDAITLFFDKISSGVSILVDIFMSLIDAIGKWTGINWSFLDANQHDQLISVLGLFSQFKKWVEDLTGIKIPSFSQIVEGFDSLFHIRWDSAELLKSDSFVDKIHGLYISLEQFVERLLALVGIDVDVPSWKQFQETFEKIKTTFEPLGNIFTNVKDGLEKFISAVAGIKPIELLAKAIGAIWTTIKTVGANLKPYFDSFVQSCSKFFEGIKGAIGKFSIERFLNIVTSIFGIFAVQSITAGFEKVKEFFDNSGGLLGQIVDFVKGIREAGKGAEGSKSIGQYLGDFISGIKSSFEEGVDTIATFKSLATAIAILVASIFVLSTIEPEHLKTALNAITTMFLDLFGSIALFNKFGGETDTDALTSISKTFIKISAAVLILSFAIAKLSGLSPDQMKQGLLGMATIIAAIFAFCYLMGKTKNSGISKEQVSGLLSVVIAVALLSKVVESMGNLNDSQITKGLTAMAGILFEIFMFIWLISQSKADGFKVSQAVGILVIAVAIRALQAPLMAFADMEWTQIAKGLAVVGALLLEFGIFATIVSKTKGVVAAAVGMLVVSIAIGKVFDAIKGLEDITKPETISTGLMLITMILLEMAVFANVVKGGTVIAAAASILILAVALRAMTAPLIAFGQMKPAAIAKSMIVMAGALVILGVAGKIFGSVAPAVLMLSGAVVLLAVGIGALSIGIRLFGGALPMFAARFIATIGILLAGLIAAIPMIATFVVQLLTTFVVTVNNSLGMIISSAFGIIAALCQGIIMAVPLIAEAALTIILGLAVTLINYMDLITAAAVVLVISFVNGLANALRDNTPVILGAFGNLLSAVIEFILSSIQEVTKDIPVIGEKISGALDKAKDAVNKFFVADDLTQEADKAKQDVTQKFNEMSSSIKEEVSGQVSELTQENAYADAGAANGTSYKESLLSSLMGGEEGSIGANISQGVADGILENGDVPVEAAGQVGTNVIGMLQEATGVQSPSTKGIEVGQYIDEGIAQGITDNQGVVRQAMDDAFSGMILTAINPETASVPGSRAALAFGLGFNSSMRVVTGNTVRVMAAFVQQFMSKTVSGIRAKQGMTKSAGTTIAMSAVNGFKNGSKGAYLVGQNAVLGFVNGMRSKITTAAKTAAQVANAAKNSAKRALQEQSPSRAFFEIGAFADQGLINGLLYLQDDVAKASASVAEDALDVMQMTINHISDLIDHEYDFSPTITPVIDMSDVEEGFNSIDKYVSKRYSMSAGMAGIQRPIGAVSYIPAAYNNVSQAAIAGGGTTNYNITVNAPTGNARDIARAIEKIIVRR